MNEIIERMRRGERITETDSDFSRLCEEVENTRRLVGELNTGAPTSTKAVSRLKTAYLSGREPKSSQKVIPKNPNSVIRCIPSRSLFAARRGLVRER